MDKVYAHPLRDTSELSENDQAKPKDSDLTLKGFNVR